MTIYGILDLSLKGYIVAIILLTQITIAGVTIFLHRSQTHHALTLHPIMSHFFRFWLWMTTGISTKEWVAIHRKHHAKCETPEDPHSPKILGIKTVLFEGAEVYRAAKTKETIMRYGHGTPEDWIERNIYARHDKAGICLMLIVNLILFGIPGISIWAIQMMWVPFFAAGVINGLGHYFGYRNYEPKDNSTNIFPLAIFIGGEELHNNHHAFPTSAKLSAKWWEFDIGWLYIRLMQLLGLAKIKRSIPKLTQETQKAQIDLDTLKVIINNKLQIMTEYSQLVILPALKWERKKLGKNQNTLIGAEKLLVKPDSLLDENMKQHIASILDISPTLKHVYQFKITLQKIWEQTTATQQELLDLLKNWGKEAEKDSNQLLRKFALRLPHYSVLDNPI